MADERLYSDEEFATILRQAAEQASRGESTALSTGSGMTLAEMKAVAAQVGLDPGLVERAARALVEHQSASPLDRLMGGPLRHALVSNLPVALDETEAARLLSAVRISAAVPGTQDVGHSGALGMTWHDGGQTEALGVSARGDGSGTQLNVTLDRRGTFGIVVAATGVTTFLAFLFAATALYPESHALGSVGVATALVGPLAAARAYWAASTRRVRERMQAVMGTLRQTLDRPDDTTPKP